jgi:hypothetical protein
MTEPTRPAPRPRRGRTTDRPRPGHRAARPAPPPAPAPDPTGDVVPGDPPVPITVWHIPRPPAGTLTSAALVRRLIVNYTRPGARVVDLTGCGQLTAADSQPAAMVITAWPAGRVTATAYLTSCARALRPGGFVAVVITATDTPDQLGDVVTAARAAGLVYLQHIVVAHQFTPHTGPSHTGSNPEPEPHGDTHRPAAGLDHHGRHLRVHTDLLVLMLPGDAHA